MEASIKSVPEWTVYDNVNWIDQIWLNLSEPFKNVFATVSKEHRTTNGSTQKPGSLWDLLFNHSIRSPQEKGCENLRTENMQEVRWFDCNSSTYMCNNVEKKTLRLHRDAFSQSRRSEPNSTARDAWRVAKDESERSDVLCMSLSRQVTLWTFLKPSRSQVSLRNLWSAMRECTNKVLHHMLTPKIRNSLALLIQLWKKTSLPHQVTD